ncbi:hypothetical protein V865_003509 [Kwoniella europaea PYCC6329]|uniref:Aminoglycoside phosphotransferase domain-containing protein n=1 Tax=Kwoniella europaea PYCC6329 TaxID=1423913 RepID=A0AAX4KFZ9_9TREE
MYAYPMINWRTWDNTLIWTIEIKLNHILEHINTHQSALEKEVSTIRPGHTCSLIIPKLEDLVKSKWYAGFNVHFLITFEDDVNWLLRVRQPYGPSPPQEISDIVMTRLPFDYFIYEFVEGKPLKINKDPYKPIELPPNELRKFVEGYAKIQIQLSNIPLEHAPIGSLFTSPNDEISAKDVRVGPMIGTLTFMQPCPPYFFGLFKTNKERYLAHIDATLQYISKGALYKGNLMDDYLWHLELRELVNGCKELDKQTDKVYVKHADERGDHLMIDEEGNIISILDWEWAYVTTKEEAFSTPKIFNQDYKWMRLGNNSLREAERILIECYEHHGRSDLADCVRRCKLYTRLEGIGSYDPLCVKKGFREVFGDDIPEDFHPPENDVDWRIYMMKRYENLEELKKVMEDYGWSIERAENEKEKWRIRQVEIETERKKWMTEEEEKMKKRFEEMKKAYYEGRREMLSLELRAWK